MAKTSRHTSTEVETGDGFEARLTHLTEGYTVVFETYYEDIAGSSIAMELSNEPSPVARWGYVLTGRLGCRYGDREEVAEAGEAYYFPAGHTLIPHPGTELVEFSPTEAR